MDSQAALTGPWIAFGVAAAALLAVLATAAVLVFRSHRPTGSGAAAGALDGSAGPEPAEAGSFPHDDLPDFRDHPPGLREARSAPARGAAPVALAARPAPGASSPATAPRSLRLSPTALALLLMAAAALLLVIAAAGVGLATRADAASGSAAGPPLPVPPAHPAPGQTGAGALADTVLPLTSDGTTLRLTFGSVVLGLREDGVTATYPEVAVTAAGGRALAHVRLPVFDCPTRAAPSDPEAAGCVAGTTEFADLPTPALRVSEDGDTLIARGRFPSYIRPEGALPEYTGRVYDLTITARIGHAGADGRAPVSGVLVMGSERAESIDAPEVNVAQVAR